MKKETTGTKRILGRKLAKELATEDMKKVMGGAGTISCSAGSDDDCDERIFVY
jgi:hypothetical protein